MTQASTAVAPVASDLEATIQWAVGQRDRVRQLAAEAIAQGVRAVWFTGCGGSVYASSPAGYLLTRKGRALASFRMNADELNHARPAALGGQSLVLASSHSGKTPETLEAAATARSLGAWRVVAFTRSSESPLAATADEVFAYGSEHTVWEPKQVLYGYLAHALLAGAGDEPGADEDAAAAGYAALPGAIGHAIAQADPLLASIAAELAGEPIVYVLGAGPSEDVARCLAMCYLQEMQWRHAAAFNAGEFFHGAFEMITERMPVLLFMGEDETRPVAQRASRFLDRYTRRAFRVDSAELELPGVPAACRAEIGPIVLGALSYRLAQHYEAITGHSLENRRYMFKVDY